MTMSEPDLITNCDRASTFYLRLVGTELGERKGLLGKL